MRLQFVRNNGGTSYESASAFSKRFERLKHAASNQDRLVFVVTHINMISFSWKKKKLMMAFSYITYKDAYCLKGTSKIAFTRRRSCFSCRATIRAFHIGPPLVCVNSKSRRPFFSIYSPGNSITGLIVFNSVTERRSSNYIALLSLFISRQVAQFFLPHRRKLDRLALHVDQLPSTYIELRYIIRLRKLTRITQKQDRNRVYFRPLCSLR